MKEKGSTSLSQVLKDKPKGGMAAIRKKFQLSIGADDEEASEEKKEEPLKIEKEESPKL